MPDATIPTCIINAKTRAISVHEEYRNLGVQSDEKVMRLRFTCPKIVGDNVDLSTLNLYVNYQNGNNQKNIYLITDVAVSGDNITFSWLLSRHVTAYKGTVRYIICAKKSEDGNTINEWNTVPASGIVSEGLEATTEVEEQNADVIEQILTSIDGIGEGIPLATSDKLWELVPCGATNSDGTINNGIYRIQGILYYATSKVIPYQNFKIGIVPVNDTVPYGLLFVSQSISQNPLINGKIAWRYVTRYGDIYGITNLDGSENPTPLSYSTLANSISSGSTDHQHPTSKAVYDYVTEIQNGNNTNFQNINTCFDEIASTFPSKEDASNKVTQLSDTATDMQYPSAKCVFDSLESIKSFTQIDPTELLLVEDLEEGAYRIRCTRGYGVRIYVGGTVMDTFTAKDGILYVSKTGLQGRTQWTFFGGGLAGMSSPLSIGIWSGVVSVSGTGAVSCTINNYETKSNCVDEITDLTSAYKYPSVGAVRDYVQAALYVDSEAVV